MADPTAPQNIEQTAAAVRGLLGCAAAGLLLVVGIAVLLVILQPDYTPATADQRSDLMRRYEAVMATHDFNRDDRALLARLAAHAQAEETSAHAMGVLAAGIVGTGHDGLITPEERAAMQELDALLEGNPGAGVWTMTRLLWGNDTLQARYNALADLFEAQDAATGEGEDA